MSGVLGIYSTTGRNVVNDLYYGMIALQHRGQESCGIAATRNRNISYIKDLGLVSEVFTDEKLAELDGDMGIAQVRYAPRGEGFRENAQPLVIRYIKGALGIAHNGSIINAAELRSDFERTGAIFQTTSDTEVMAYAIARERINTDSVEEAISRAMERLVGAYSVVLTSPRKLIAVKDPWGFRPLCIGRRNGDIIFASETAALECLGATFERELENGEIVVVEDGEVRSYSHGKPQYPKRLCVFEYIYFARPDSVVEGQLVARSRRLAGEILAKEHPADCDIVIGVPDSGLQAAAGYARALNLPCEEGIIKNRYIPRTFIKPEPESRTRAVRLKLNPMRDIIEGKRVLLVDDSLVRGTTMKIIVKSLRDAGAREVHVRISSPPFRFPCYYGTDVPEVGQLVAVGNTEEQTARMLDADSLRYLPVDRVRDLARDADCGLCTACFTGDYPIEK
ncbi:MAG: amidophosphoribosyltransferase [Clostridiales bacterium]|jgi:amidophosphoribosyltransferase|nr:amidophosphoribosyltransferase [Clostridiales bacterium]